VSSVFIIGVAAAVIAIVVIAGYYYMRYRRGSVKVTLTRNSFSPGEKITGTFELTTRQDIEGKRLYAALIGEEVTRAPHQGSTGKGSQTQTKEIYRDEHTIEEGVIYPAGQTIERDFELTAPTSSRDGGLELPPGKTLQLGKVVFSGSRTNLRWSVEAWLDAEGIDLFSSENVTIDFPH
jgi:hypothetical protein